MYPATTGWLNIKFVSHILPQRYFSTARMSMSKTPSTASARKTAVPRPSASLIVLSPNKSSKPVPSSSGTRASEYRVCLIQRHSQMKVSAGATVFPGGNLSPADTASAKEYAPDTLSEEARDLLALRICALREAFEECGILAGLPSSVVLTDEKLRKKQKEVYDNPARFLQIYKQLQKETGQSCEPPFGELMHWSVWTTPVVSPKRFKTDFFLYILPRSTNADDVEKHVVLSADGSETASASWITPQAAIDSCIKAQSTFMLPPQLYLLAELAQLPTLDSVRQHARTRKLLHILPIMTPKIITSTTGMYRALAYAGDEEYPKRDEAGPHGARHRAYVVAAPDKDGNVKPVVPFRVMAVSRRGVKDFDDMQEGQVPVSLGDGIIDDKPPRANL